MDNAAPLEIAKPIDGYKWIVSNPDLLGGQPTIAGTRLSVSHILACLSEGMTPEQIAVDYPGYIIEATSEVLKFASEKLESNVAA
jgi:uncharacterized protein (DUF433 family)